MGMGFAMFGATVAEKFERIVEVGGGIAQTSTIRWNFSAAVAQSYLDIGTPLRLVLRDNYPLMGRLKIASNPGLALKSRFWRPCFSLLVRITYALGAFAPPTIPRQ